MRSIALGLLALLLVACGQQGGASGDLWKRSAIHAAKERGTLRVATEPEFPPFEYIKDGEIVGFDVDLANIIAEHLGVKLELRRTKWDAIIPTLLSGDVDLIISGMTATPERALKVSYTDPYFLTQLNLLVSKTRAAEAQGVADLDKEGRIIAVKLGTTGDITAKRVFKQATVRQFQTQNLAALEVAQGTADAFVYDLAAVRAQHAKHEATTFVIETPISQEPYAIACRKGDPETLAWLNLVLRTLRLDGRMKELYDKHGLEGSR